MFSESFLALPFPFPTSTLNLPILLLYPALTRFDSTVSGFSIWDPTLKGNVSGEFVCMCVYKRACIPAYVYICMQVCMDVYMDEYARGNCVEVCMFIQCRGSMQCMYVGAVHVCV